MDVTGDAASAGYGAREATKPAASTAFGHGPDSGRGRNSNYAALDLGTNNCRLLIARPAAEGFRVVDAFSRIVRLGEGIGRNGSLSQEAMRRTIAALAVCRDKLVARDVRRCRLIATEACRIASNGPAFIDRVREETGLELEIVDRETEARLAAQGCASLADARAAGIVLFDIGGGSSEIVWLASAGPAPPADAGATGHPMGDATGDPMRERVRCWSSLQLGVVTLAERFGGYHVDEAAFDAMVECVSGALADFVERAAREKRCPNFHLLGTSGTVTTIAGIHLGLLRYDRRRVDGLWMSADEVTQAMARLRAMTYEDRAADGCIGPERADLVLAGCAIFEAIRRAFPAERVRIADRGLREGILMQLMSADNVWGDRPRRAERAR